MHSQHAQLELFYVSALSNLYLLVLTCTYLYLNPPPPSLSLSISLYICIYISYLCVNVQLEVTGGDVDGLELEFISYSDAMNFKTLQVIHTHHRHCYNSVSLNMGVVYKLHGCCKLAHHVWCFAVSISHYVLLYICVCVLRTLCTSLGVPQP